MLRACAAPCDVSVWRACAGDALVRAWVMRLERAAWLRGVEVARPVVEGLARRVAAAVAVWRDGLAARLEWAERAARCGALALRSLRQDLAAAMLARRAAADVLRREAR